MAKQDEEKRVKSFSDEKNLFYHYHYYPYDYVMFIRIFENQISR